nr:hypothetical protein [uncultured Desulfobacter sp.]
MANYRLDELAEALQGILRESQQRINVAAGERLKSVVHIDKHGDPESLTR